MNNYYTYYDTFKTNVLKAVLQNHIKELEDIGNGVYKVSNDRATNIMKRVDVIRTILKERSTK